MARPTVHRLVIAAIAIVALVAAIYAPVRHFEFVTFDDYDFVVDNPHVAAGLTTDSARWAFAHAYDAAGGPLTWLSHMLDVELFGMTAGPHHLQSVVLHALNAVLLLLVLWQATGSTWRSAFVAALFAVHPMHVESVAWVSERKDVLSSTFWLITTWAYVRFVRQPGAGRYAVVALAFTLGLLAKPMIATLPFVLLLLDVWPLARVTWSWSDRARWRTLVIEKLPLIALAAGSMVWTLLAQRGIGAVATVQALPLGARVANAAVSVLAYITKLSWPSHLAVFYPYPRELRLGLLLASVAILPAMSFAAWRVRRHQPYVAVGWLWFLVTLVPVLGLVQVGSHAMADRFTYLPAIGLFLIAAWGGRALLAMVTRSHRAISLGVALSVVVVLTIAARSQVNYWQTSETLWGRALAVTTGNFRAHAGLAEVRASEGRIDEAIAHYTEAVRLAPDEGEWFLNLGLLLAQRGDVDKAVASLTQAVRLRPDDAGAHNNLGAMLARQGRTTDALVQYRRAIELRPEYALAHRNLGLALAAQGDMASGLQSCLEAIRLAPNEAAWHYEVAVMLLGQRRVPEAIAHLKDTLRLDPAHEGARQTLAALAK